MKINPQIFREYDIRGIWKKDLTKEVFQIIGLALSKKGKKFLVGYDIRKSSPFLAKALISGLVTGRAKVILAKRGNFGLILFSGKKAKADFTLFITASHLPPQWNGLKIHDREGMPISPQKIKEKVLKLEREKINFKRPKFKLVNFKKDYEKFFFDHFSFLKNSNLKVILDCGGGATALVAPKIFRRFFKLKKIFCKVDPSFSKRPSEPKEEALTELKKQVLKEKADFGVAFDGDGDRGVIIDDKGRYLRGDIVGIILARDFLKSKNKKIVKTVSCSMKVEEKLKKFLAKIIECPVGHTFVAKYCQKYNAIFGMEESSHILMPKILPFDDALLIPLKLAEILKKEKRKLSSLIDEIGIYPFEEIAFKCEDEIKFEIVKKLQEEFKRKYKKVNTLDGVKVYFRDGWVLIRASNTSPKIRLYVEAKTKEKLRFLKEKFQKILKEKIKKYSCKL